jgi:hypothetical protein
MTNPESQANAQGSRVKGLLAKLTLLGVVLAILVPTAELAVRLIFGERFARRPVFLTHAKPTGWGLSANLNDTFWASDFSIRVNTDEYGNRLGARGEVSDDSRLVILLGDSYTFGWGVSSDETFASYLDQQLESLDENLRVVNLGVSGYGTLAYAERFRVFLGNINPERVHSVFILHVDNDMVDNVGFALYRSGFSAPTTVSHKEKSPWNLVNLIRQVQLQWRAEPERGDLEGPATDVRVRAAWWHASERSGFLKIDEGERVDIRSVDGRRELAHIETLRSGQLTPLQEKLFRVGLRNINCTLPNRKLPIYHSVIDMAYKSAGAQNWYALAIENLLDPNNFCGNDVRFVGLARVPASRVDKQHNSHSGGHFTPAMNEAVAELIFDIVFKGKVGAEPEMSAAVEEGD